MIDQELKDAYYALCDRLAKAGIIDCSLGADTVAGLTVEEHMRKMLREYGETDERDHADEMEAVEISEYPGGPLRTAHAFHQPELLAMQALKCERGIAKIPGRARGARRVVRRVHPGDAPAAR